jgi:hypothetical protein
MELFRLLSASVRDRSVEGEHQLLLELFSNSLSAVLDDASFTSQTQNQ